MESADYSFWADGEIPPPRDSNDREDLLFKLGVLKPYASRSTLVHDTIGIIEALLKTTNVHSPGATYKASNRHPGYVELCKSGSTLMYGYFDAAGRFMETDLKTDVGS